MLVHLWTSGFLLPCGIFFWIIAPRTPRAVSCNELSGGSNAAWTVTQPLNFCSSLEPAKSRLSDSEARFMFFQIFPNSIPGSRCMFLPVVASSLALTT